MSAFIETEGNTVEEAIEIALEELGVDRSNVNVEIMKGETKGFLGIGAGKARVKVTVVDSSPEKDIAGEAVRTVKEIIEHLGIEGSIETLEKEDVVEINVSGSDLGLLIGRRGETLGAIQTIANIIAKKHSMNKKIIIDVENYRQRRVDDMIEMAKRSAEKAVRTGQTVPLRPMSSYDRRIIHIALRDIDGVDTESEGEEPNRQVIIVPKI